AADGLSSRSSGAADVVDDDNVEPLGIVDAFDVALHSVLLRLLANDEGRNRAAEMFDAFACYGERDRVGAESQSTYGIGLPAASFNSIQAKPSDQRHGLRRIRGELRIHVN